MLIFMGLKNILNIVMNSLSILILLHSITGFESIMVTSKNILANTKWATEPVSL